MYTKEVKGENKRGGGERENRGEKGEKRGQEEKREKEEKKRSVRIIFIESRSTPISLYIQIRNDSAHSD